MPKYTDDQLDRARNTDLERFLRFRGEKLVRSGSEYRWVYRDGGGTHDSVTVRGSEWYDHKRGFGGDAIGFLQEFMDMDFKAAVAALLDGEQPEFSTKPTLQAPKPFIIPERAANMHRLYAYLTQTRHLAPDVITHFVRAGTLYEDAARHNAVFLGLDETGNVRSAALKGTLTASNFRQTLTGSDTRYAFHHKGMSDKLFVFEAPVDMLSYISMHQQDWQNHSYIALDGLSSKAMHYFLSQNTHIMEVLLCLDNDAAGIEAAQKFHDELTARGYSDVKRLVSINKDFNDDIKARLGHPAIPAQKHPKIEAYCAVVDTLLDLNIGAYSEYVKSNDMRVVINSIRRELEHLTGDPQTWEPHLLRSVMLSAMLASNRTKRRFLQELVDGYKPYTDKGRLKTHVNEIFERFSVLSNKKENPELIAFADVCIRACVYLKTDYSLDLDRQEAFNMERESLEFEITMS